MTKIVNLAKLGFLKETIMETIVSTYNTAGQPSAAPMGVESEDMKHLIIKPYVSSSTYENLKTRRCAVVNVTSDPDLFYRTAFKEIDPRLRIPSEWFKKAELIDAPRLRMVDAFIEVCVSDIKSVESERAEVKCIVKHSRKLSSTPRPYCRGTFATIEAVIHATRVRLFLSNGEIREADKLVEFIEYYHGLVDRVAPHSVFAVIMDDIVLRIRSWRKKVEGLH